MTKRRYHLWYGPHAYKGYAPQMFWQLSHGPGRRQPIMIYADREVLLIRLNSRLLRQERKRKHRVC